MKISGWVETPFFFKLHTKPLTCLITFSRSPVRVLCSYPLPDEWLTPVEQEILDGPPVTDLKAVASPLTSTIAIEGHTKVKYGDKVKVVVQLRDEKGREVVSGGHEVRVWMVRKGEGTGLRAAADVTYLRHGMYVALLPVLWSGETQVLAALVRPREFRRVALKLLDHMKMLIPIIMEYTDQHTSQVSE